MKIEKIASDGARVEICDDVIGERIRVSRNGVQWTSIALSPAIAVAMLESLSEYLASESASSPAVQKGASEELRNRTWERDVWKRDEKQ